MIDAAAMRKLRLESGLDLSIAVKQGRFRAHEGCGRECRPIGEYRDSWAGAFADCRSRAGL